jgi:hypothetical protein
MDSQFMIVVHNGKYYIRDLGYVHTTRVKLDLRSEAQIQEGSIVDVGKVIHYHFDKLTHYDIPSHKPTDNFFIMRPMDKSYAVDREDFPYLRARPSWISPEENVDNVQNEINIFADGSKL